MSRFNDGGQIDRSQPIHFTFNGKTYQGYHGDTLASALIANDVLMLARSFKYHRPRGVVAASFEEPNALVQLHSNGDQPNVLATCIPLVDGLKASSVNCWPSLQWDVGVVNGWFSALLPAGFYYKTFMWGPWARYARTIRRVAGLGRIAHTHTPTRSEKRHTHTDVLVVGAGPAGISAAVHAGQCGARVLLIEQDDRLGGDLLTHPATIDDSDETDWIETQRASLLNLPNVSVLTQTTLFGYYDHNLLIAHQRQPQESFVDERLWHIRASQVVLATGSVERPLVFANNDRPGLMLFSAFLTYLHRYAVYPGKGIVILTNNNSVYASLEYLKSRLINVVAVVDTRETDNSIERTLCQSLSIPRFIGSGIVEVLGARRVTAAIVVDNQGQRHPINCDLVAMAGGFNPLVHLHSQSGAKPVYDESLATFVPGDSVQQEQSTGAAAGVFGLTDCINDGKMAGLNAACAAGFNQSLASASTAVPRDEECAAFDITAQWHLDVSAKEKNPAFVDYQNDVSVDDIKLAIRENFVSVEHVKRYTTAGMAIDQGKISNANVIGVMAKVLDTPIDAVGTTTYRPPFQPVRFSALTGIDREQLVIPARTTPITPWHKRHGAVMDEAGANFRRPFYYPNDGESMTAAVQRAALAVRNGVGIYDGSPLGKFELVGDHVSQLLERIYTNRWDKLKNGQGRYGLMLREDGRLFDDGVTFRLNEHRYLMTTSTGAASDVYRQMTRLLHCEWSDLNVHVINVSAAWTNICVCGPNCRTVLLNLGLDAKLVNSLPFMHLVSTNIDDVPIRLARVSYTGELSFEISVRSKFGLSLWQKIMSAGKDVKITPVGSETSAVLRIEKGFISPGHEGDNITNAFDAGLGWVVAMDKPDFIGKRSLQRDLRQSFVRQHVVGLLPTNPQNVPAEGSALITPGSGTSSQSADFQGHVTASCFSPTLDRSICLALLKNGQDRHGETITISGLDATIDATVTQPCFYDPKGLRMRS